MCHHQLSVFCADAANHTRVALTLPTHSSRNVHSRCETTHHLFPRSTKYKCHSLNRWNNKQSRQQCFTPPVTFYGCTQAEDLQFLWECCQQKTLAHKSHDEERCGPTLFRGNTTLNVGIYIAKKVITGFICYCQ